MKRVRACMLGGTALALTALVWHCGSTRAGEDDLVTVKKLAAAIKANPDAGFKMAADMGKKLKSLESIMHGFKRRKDDGFGVGKTPGVIVPDGIELYINALQRDGISKTALDKNADAIEELAYISAAVAEATKYYENKALFKKKSQKEWVALSEKMREGAVKLAAAAKSKGAAEVKAAAKILNDSCTRCHSDFREKS